MIRILTTVALVAASTIVSEAKTVSVASRVGHSTERTDVNRSADTTTGLQVLNAGKGLNISAAKTQANSLYMPPLSTMYVGGDRAMNVLENAQELQPSNAILYWENYSINDGPTTYTWNLGDIPASECDNDGFAVLFPIPTGADGRSVDVYNTPELTAAANGLEPSTFTENVTLLVGGDAEADGTRFGLLSFDLQNYGMGIHTVASGEAGEPGIPIFGYSDKTDAFWRLYTCGGDEDNLSHIPYAYVSGIINGIIPASQPMVLNGVWTYAVGKVTDEAKFTMSLYALTDEGMFKDTPIVQKTISGADLTVTETDSETSLNYYVLPFAFDEPVLLTEDGSDAGFYALMLSGFHDGGVEYFAPLMQTRPNPYETCLGFYQIEYMYQGEHVVGLSYVASHENEYGEMFCAFAMNLDAQYPWLECGTSLVNFEGGEQSVALRSYYPASELKVTLADGSSLPSWLNVSAEGRFDSAKLTFGALDSDPAFDGDILISAPGVEATLHLTKTSGVGDAMVAAENEIVETYDILGRKVDADNASYRVLIVRHSDGTYSKIIR